MTPEGKKHWQGNNYKVKYKTKKARRELCDRWCEHIAAGYSQESFTECHAKTVKSYAAKHPDDFPAEKMAAAKRGNYFFWEKAGIAGMMGRVDGFNATAWIFNMKNRHGWRNDPVEPIGNQSGDTESKIELVSSILSLVKPSTTQESDDESV